MDDRRMGSSILILNLQEVGDDENGGDGSPCGYNEVGSGTGELLKAGCISRGGVGGGTVGAGVIGGIVGGDGSGGICTGCVGSGRSGGSVGCGISGGLASEPWTPSIAVLEAVPVEGRVLVLIRSRVSNCEQWNLPYIGWISHIGHLQSCH